MSDKPLVVLDTNVVLDWLVFDDARVATLAQQIERRELVWAVCPAMRRELTHMLGHTSLARWSPDAERALAVVDRLARWVPDPSGGGLASPRCSDPDDQVFLDLALTERAACLYTRDRALLKLARAARALGLSIQAP